jgi:signal recognition particle GTPase
MQMTVNVNPDPHAEGFTPQPIYNVTAVFDDLHDVISAVRSLKQYGFTDECTSVFIGKEGLSKLDLHGEDHGVLARVTRALESLTAEEQANRDAEAALKEGRIFITVQTVGSDEQKETVEHVLKAHRAHSLRFFGRWTVERL